MTPKHLGSVPRSVTWSPQEETILFELRSSRPKAKWVEIHFAYNALVPYHRQRTVDALCAKWKTLKRKVEDTIPNERLQKGTIKDPRHTTNELCQNIREVRAIPLLIFLQIVITVDLARPPTTGGK